MNRSFIAFTIAALSLCSSHPAHASGDDDDATVIAALADLQSSEVQVRRDAARKLLLRRTSTPRAIAALIEALADRDPQVWSDALRALRELGPKAHAAVPVIVEALDHDRAQVRYRSADTLARIGPSSMPALVKALTSDSARRRAGAAQALGWIGVSAAKSTPHLIALLGDTDATVRDQAALALGRFGGQSVSPLLGVLADTESDAIAGALRALQAIGPPAHATLSTVKEFVHDGRADVRSSAARAVALIGLAPSELVPLLTQLLQDDDAAVRHTAGELLVLVRPPAIAIAGLNQLVARGDVATVLRAAHLLNLLDVGGASEISSNAAAVLVGALVRIGESDSDFVLPEALSAFGVVAVPSILGALTTPSLGESTLRRLVTALVEIGSDAIPSLVDSLDHRSPGVRAGASLALAMGKSADADLRARIVARIASLLHDDAAIVRAAAAETLGEFGASARDRSDDLAAALSDTSAAVRAAAAIALSQTAGDDVEHTSLYVGALTDPETQVRRAATVSLASQPRTAARATQALVNALRDTDSQIRSEASRALGAAAGVATDTVTAAIVPPLLESLQDPVPTVRASAAFALGTVNAPGPPLLAGLGAAIADASVSVRRQALLSLQRHGEKSLPCVPQLVSALHHEESAFRILVIESFRPIIHDVTQLVPPLLKALKDADREVRRVAAYELGEIGPPAQAAVPALFNLMEDDEDRYAARISLAKIGPHDLPLLVEKMKHESPFVRLAAIEGMNNLGIDALRAVPFLRERLADKELLEQSQMGRDYGIRRRIEAVVLKLSKYHEF